jgi:tetratricopeptide (TPR) repeat protein
VIDLTQWSETDFMTLCRDILAGQGMARARHLSAVKGVQFFGLMLVRESTDGMFRSEERWLWVFMRKPLNTQQIEPLVQASMATNVDYLQIVVFGEVTGEAEALLREQLAPEKIHLVLLSGLLAQALAVDYGSAEALASLSAPDGFSFARLRQEAMTQVEKAPWRKRFQTASIQPSRVLPLHVEEVALAEADLPRALQRGSFLLLGAAGAGKTTSLLMLAKTLAEASGLTPLFLPAGSYQGNFWKMVCQALSFDGKAVSLATAQRLVTSGALVLLLDGINEVQDAELQGQLVKALNKLTSPNSPAAHTRWVISGRVHDYEQNRRSLIHLEARRWEIQPLTPDLIYDFLADALGNRRQAKALYDDLGPSVRDICANPLLLDILLTLYQETGQAPVGRGALYQQFIDLLLRWDRERGLGTSEREVLSSLLPAPLTNERYKALVEEALTALAVAMPTTMIKWSDAHALFVGCLNHATNPQKAATLLLEELTRSGILQRRGVHNHISFLHHTFQEYFQVRQLMVRPVEKIIPKGGVLAQQRESVLFLAGLSSNPTRLIKRALEIDDLGLAFDIVRDSSQTVPAFLMRQLTGKLWDSARGGGGIVGGKRRWALLFSRLATRLGKSVETLAAEVDSHLSEVAQIEHLMGFYSQLGDARAQRRVLKQAISGQGLPDSLLFGTAAAAYNSNHYKLALKLFKRYLEKFPDEAVALSYRASAFKKLGHKEEALADFQRAIELGDGSVRRLNLAVLLHELGQREEAREQALIALGHDPTFAEAHSFLGSWLEGEEPEKALWHREQAVRYAQHNQRLHWYSRKLANLQEQLGHHAGAIRSLRQLIALDPTSWRVKSWKRRIAQLRQKIDAEARTRSARERLEEEGELPLPTLTLEWLQAAGLTVKNATLTWLMAEGGRGLPNQLPVVLMPEPIVRAKELREAQDSLPQEARQAKQMIMVTAAETLSLAARHQLAALQDEQKVALVTALEVRDALLQSDRDCRLLLDRALTRAGRLDNPFDYKGIVREHTEFFGRKQELEELIGLIGRGQQVGLYGIHKIGKSSLLEQLRRKLHLSHPEISVVKVELGSHLKDASDFYHEVLHKLPGLTDIPPKQRLTREAFQHALQAFHQKRTRERPNHRLLLIIDEYAHLIPDRRGQGGMRDFIEVLGLLKALHQEEGWLLILPCGRTAAIHQQANLGAYENPFLDLLHTHFLQPLPRHENDALMMTLGTRAGLTFTSEALEALYQETGGHPTFSRALGSQILPVGSGEANDTLPSEVDAEQVKRAVEKLLASRTQKALLLAIYQERFDEDEQELATLLALEESLPRQALFPKNANRDRRRQIRDALQNLIDTSVLIQQPDGQIRHRYRLLWRLIQQEMEDLGY